MDPFHGDRRRAVEREPFISVRRLQEIAASERDAWDGRISDRPFVLLSQPTVVDPSRAPAGRHVAWTYCHVPSCISRSTCCRGSNSKSSASLQAFATASSRRSVMRPADIERHNENFVGGDIASGVVDLRQLFTRPTWRTYSTPVRGLYLCSASTPPGVGVHGMCGYHAAQRALREVLRD